MKFFLDLVKLVVAKKNTSKWSKNLLLLKNFFSLLFIIYYFFYLNLFVVYSFLMRLLIYFTKIEKFNLIYYNYLLLNVTETEAVTEISNK